MNNIKKKVPESTISRLCVYLRELAKLSEMNIKTVSSSELGEMANLSDAQVRKDLGYFGQFGVSGSGYAINDLKEALEKILGKDRTWNVAIVGVGHMGYALLMYSGFRKYGLDVVAAFDTDVYKAGNKIGDVAIEPLEALPEAARKKNISLAIITVPADQAQRVADILVESGIECILNFAPMSLHVPENVKVKNVDLSRELETLSYFLVNKESPKEDK
ncbi:MAG: redox-sensing transcriptional repressor Rex [Candidatus Omnitrophota bacterium]